MAKTRSIDPILLQKIKDEYIYGNINESGTTDYLSYDSLAEKYDVPVGALKRAGNPKDDDGSINWKALRDTYQTKNDLKTIEKKSSVTASLILKSDDKFQDTFELGRTIGEMQLRRNKAYLESDEKHYISGTQLKHTIEAIKGCQDGIKTAQGEITDRVKIESTVNEEIIKDPDYIQAKAQAMNDYYAKNKGRKNSD